MKKVLIKDVAKILNGYAFKSSNYSDAGFQVIRIKNVQKGYISNENPKFIEIDESKFKRFILAEGDLLMSLTGNVGRVGIVKNSNLPAVLNQRVAKIEIRTDEILPDYLFHFFNNDLVETKLMQKGKGIAQKNIGSQDIESLEIPLPTLEEQKRIVHILDQADSLRQKRQKAILLLDDYLKAVFLEMFGDPVTNPKGWDVIKLSEISDIRSGVTKGRSLDKAKTVMIPYMRVANVQDEHIDLREIKQIEVLPSDIEKYRLEPGDLLLTEGGDPDKLGRGGIWEGQIEDCIHQNHIFRVRLNPKLSIPEFMSALIGSNYGKKYFLKSAKQTTGIATINSTQLKKFPALLPPINLQNKFFEMVRKCAVVKKIMQSQNKELDTNFNAMMQKVFTK